MSVSLKQVAAHAGVSMSTVSRVLSGDARAQIALETQDVVRRAASELGYKPNRFARSLITGRTHTLGLMISKISNPFFVSLIEHAELAAKDGGFSIVIDTSGAHARDYIQSGHLADWPVDGVVMWTWAGQKLADFLGARASVTPVVYICEEPRDDGAGCVVYDLAGGAQQAVEFALQRGYKKLAHLVPYAPGDWDGPFLRDDIYRAACDQAGVNLETIVAHPKQETREAGFQTALVIAARPKAQRPDVLLCHNDIMAVGAYHGFVRAGLCIPQDIAVIGFDGIDEGRFLDRRLTTVEMPVEEIGRRAVELLLAHILGVESRREVIVPSRLIEGETA